MYLFKQIQLTVILIFFVMYFVNAAKLSTVSKVATQSSEFEDEPTTAMSTLAIEIQKILAQIQETKLVKNKALIQELIKQMKEVYHTTTTKYTCAKCKTKAMPPMPLNW